MNDKKLMSVKSVVEYYDNDFIEYQKYLFTIPELAFEKNEIIDNLRQSLCKSVLDIGAGSGQWLNYYFDIPESYIAIDRSKNSCKKLMQAFQKRMQSLIIYNDDVFGIDYNKLPCFESIIFFFFISHFSNETIIQLLDNIIRAKPEFKNILIIDSYWSNLRKEKYEDNSLKMRERKFIDKYRIRIPKRFITKKDIALISDDLNLRFDFKYHGDYWMYSELWNQ